MRKRVVILILVCMFGMPLPVRADWECGSVKRVNDIFSKAVAAEKAGKLKEAFVGYHKAEVFLPCGGEKNPVESDAAAGMKRVGRAIGAGEEKKGNLYSNVQVVAMGDTTGVDTAAAFAWFEETGNLSDADRVMMKLVKSRPEDKNTFELVLKHFTERQGRSESLKQEYGYAYDPGNLKELEKTASGNGERALEREERAFNKKDAINGQSLAQLDHAREWFKFFADAREKSVVQRAEKRGDTLAQEDGVNFLSGALVFYKVANDPPEKIKKVKDKANRLGDAAAKKNDAVTAIAYYSVSGNKARADELGKNLQKEQEKLRQGIEKSYTPEKQAEMKKKAEEMKREAEDPNRRKRLKKEQSDLEKELGM